MTFADLWASWNPNNHGRYSNPAYDALIRKAMGTGEAQVRMDAMAAAAQIAIDDVVILPAYERFASTVQNPRLVLP